MLQLMGAGSGQVRGDKQNDPAKGSTEQAKAEAARTMVALFGTPVHRYDPTKVIAGLQLCSVGGHIEAATSLKCAFL